MNDLVCPAWPKEEDDAPAIEAQSRFVCFVLAGQSYGVPVAAVREVLRLPEIASVPGAPPACLGVVNLRGHIVSVLDLRRILGLPPGEPSPRQRLLVMDHGETMVAMLVDEIIDLLRVPDARIESTPPVNPGDVPVVGLVQRNVGPLFLLSHSQLVSGVGK